MYTPYEQRRKEIPFASAEYISFAPRNSFLGCPAVPMSNMGDGDVVVLGAFDYYIPALVNIPAVANLSAFGGVILGIFMFWLPLGAALWYLTVGKRASADRSLAAS